MPRITIKDIPAQKRRGRRREEKINAVIRDTLSKPRGEFHLEECLTEREARNLREAVRKRVELDGLDFQIIKRGLQLYFGKGDNER
jgi:hypothetical protein